ncbi:MAG: bacteriohopanetetrol glucosamine biosynthesis glycosyltransferase HpnI [Steroidobacteraceae bacterium]
MARMPFVPPGRTVVGFASLGLAASYAVLTVVAVLAWRAKAGRQNVRELPPVTLLKPLCGAEPGLYEHLRSFCRQDYPEFQIVCGVRDPADPACAVVKRLAAEFPQLPVELVINPQLHGNNLKISNLINMLPAARHDVLAMADSDAFVAADYLSAVTAPLLESGVGLVTCLYRGTPTPGMWSRLGAMYINEWYVPSVILAWLFGHTGYVSGQTVCLRRDTLRAIGGLQVLADYLADDHRLGELVRGLGLQIVLSHYIVQGEHHEPSFESLTRHELRWMRTIRVLRPRSFAFIFTTFSVPLAGVGIAMALPQSALSWPAWLLFAVTMIARLVLHLVYRWRERAPLRDLWLLPVRDLLICWVWWRSFFTTRVVWRGEEFDVDADGVMRPLS